MPNLKDEEIDQKIINVQYKLNSKLKEEGYNCTVSVVPVASPDERVKRMWIYRIVQDNMYVQDFESWQTHKNEVYWNYFR